MPSQRVPSRPYGGVSASDRVAARRETFLEAGRELFGTAGYGATGVRDICRQAGLTDRYFYESFRDRAALFLAVFDRIVDDLFAAVAQAVFGAEPTVAAQLRAAVGTFLQSMEDDPRTPRLIFSEPAAVGVDAEGHMRATLRRFATLVAATARPHMQASDADLQLLGLAVVGTMERVVIEWQEGQLEGPAARLTDDCVALFARLIDER